MSDLKELASLKACTRGLRSSEEGAGKSSIRKREHEDAILLASFPWAFKRVWKAGQLGLSGEGIGGGSSEEGANQAESPLFVLRASSPRL